MQSNKTIAAAAGERVRQGMRENRTILYYALCLLGGFLAANAVMLGSLAPFGVAFCASVKRKYSPAAALGALAGYLFSYSASKTLKYILAVVFLCALLWGVFTSRKVHTAILVAVSGISVGAPAFAITFIMGGSLYDGLLDLSEVLLCCCATYFFIRVLQTFELGIENIKQNDITAIIITFCIIVLALSNLHIFHLSIGRILAVTVILAAVQLYGEAGGAIAGVSAGLSAGILGGEPFLMCTYGFGGLLAGVFAPVGRIASSGAFVLVNLFALLAAHRIDGRYFLIEMFLASAITMLPMPEAAVRLKAARLPKGAVRQETYRTLIKGRISHMSDALRDVAQTSRKVNDKLSGLVSGDISSVYQCAADVVCRRCGNKSVCWQQRYGDTSGVFNDMLMILRRAERVEKSDFPPWFREECPHVANLATQMNRVFAEYSARETMRRKVAQVRGVVTDQFEGMALMIDAMGQELDRLTTQDAIAEGKIREYLRRLTIFPDSVTCMVDADANMKMELVLPVYKLSRISEEELTLALSDICEREFDLPFRCDAPEGSLSTLTFTEKATYTVRWGASQIGNSGSRLCGDSYNYVDGRGGHVNFILSDGMGSGGAAAVDSTMTAELLGRLIEAGVSLDAALKLVNSALLVKSGDESTATIDITGIDLYTGKAEFYKAGAAPTFLRKSGKGGYVESRSLPIGILGGVSFEKNAVTLREDDWIVMVTDGAVVGGYEWIISELEHYDGEDPKILSERLAAESKRRREDGHEDDITVIAIRMETGI